MSTAKSSVRPMIETWYKTREGDMFEVVAVDEQEDAIEIQFLDGSVEELDEDGWSTLEPKVIDPPREVFGGAPDEEAEAFDDDEPDEGDGRDWDGGADEDSK